MATATKSRKASVAAKTARKSTAKKPAAKPAKQTREAAVEAHVSRNEQGRIIQEAMTKSLSTVEQLATKLGMTPARVDNHFQYELSKGRAKLNSRKQIVVLSQPVRRNAG